MLWSWEGAYSWCCGRGSEPTVGAVIVRASLQLVMWSWEGTNSWCCGRGKEPTVGAVVVGASLQLVL